MEDCRPTKRPRANISDGGHEKPEAGGSGNKGRSKKLAAEIDGYHRLHDNVLRKVTLMRSNIATSTGKIRSSLERALDLHLQLAEWTQSHGDLLSSRCCMCDDPQFRYLFAECKHKACEACVSASGRCCDTSQHILRVFFEPCPICLNSGAGSEMAVFTCGHVACKVCFDGLPAEIKSTCITCRSSISQEPISSYK